MDLSDYLDRRYAVDRAMVKEVALQTDSALETLLETNLGRRGWPYSLTNGQSLKSDPFSQSTAAMILHAVAVAYGVISDSVLAPRVEPGMVRTAKGKKRKPADVKNLLSNGASALISELNATSARTHGRALTVSSTWGVDSPLTLTWIYELLNETDVVDRTESQPILIKVRKLAKKRIDALVKDPTLVDLEFESTDSYPVEQHPFILLRSLQLAQAVGIDRSFDLQFGKLPSIFLNQLHAELSNSEIQDGGFDPACLVFALEGLLIISPEAITDSILHQVVEVLGRAPSVATHWQPVRPLVANKRGFTLLPQSVEVANSYLRICGLERDRRISEEPLFTRSFAVLQSYTDWLLSRVFSMRVEVRAQKKDVQGWQSEHTYKPNIVHSWATSQVVLFLQYYSVMLQEHIAHASRVAAKLDFRSQTTSLDKSSEKWDKSKGHEPLQQLPPENLFRAYNRVDRLFVLPRTKPSDSRSSPKYSILLYGPPGTGKTSFAEALAEALHYDLIIVSPSDFIRSGEAGVEERAKRIFDVLLEQSNCVILFDEIDRLLLDRDSDEYLAQGDMFQFMTPSMLTKINDLRKQERSVFIIATNYAERIDGAIKRPGRIDEQIALLPPDKIQRAAIIKDCAKEVGLALRGPRIEYIVKKTPLYTFSELKYIVQSIANKVKEEHLRQTSAVERVLRENGSPTISLKSYEGRFYGASETNIEEPASNPSVAGVSGKDRDPGDVASGPWKEFALLTYLQTEIDLASIPPWAKRVLNQRELLDGLGDDIAKPLRDYINQKEKSKEKS